MSLLRKILSVKNIITRPLYLNKLPVHIQLEPVNFCNIRCKTCNWWDLKVKNQILKFDEYKIIIEKLKPLYITFSGYGEPLLNPDLSIMIAYAKSKRIKINTSTNGILLGKFYKSLLKNKLDLLNVSLDAVDRKQYLEIRGVDKFDLIADNIKNFVEYRNKINSRSKICISFVIQDKNINSLPDFIKLAENLGVDQILFQIYHPHDEIKKQELLATFDKKLVLKKLKEAHVFIKKTFLSSNLKSLIKKFELIYDTKYLNVENKMYCEKLWFSLYITSAGIVRPCCSMAFLNYNFGNILKNEYSQVINNRKFLAFRKTMKNNDRRLKICKLCIPDQILDFLFIKRY